VSERTSQAPFVGRRYPRLEDPPLLRGEARFVADLHPPRMLEVAFVRSPIAHGAIRSIDTQSARKLPGVHAVYTIADLRNVLTADRLPLQFPSNVLPQDVGPFILASEEVCFVGESIAMIAADSRYVAEDARN
jgi:aerobic carbon-monoxide dehydrogenase large subunit